MLTKVLPASLLLCLLWHTTGNLWACVLLHGWIDALYLGKIDDCTVENVTLESAPAASGSSCRAAATACTGGG